MSPSLILPCIMTILRTQIMYYLFIFVWLTQDYENVAYAIQKLFSHKKE